MRGWLEELFGFSLASEVGAYCSWVVGQESEDLHGISSYQFLPLSVEAFTHGEPGFDEDRGTRACALWHHANISLHDIVANIFNPHLLLSHFELVFGILGDQGTFLNFLID